RQALENFAARKREAAGKLEGNLSYELAVAYFRNTLRPDLYDIDSLLNDISLSINERAHELHAEVHQAMNLVIFSSLFFGSLIVGIVIFYDRRMDQAGRALAYREELFRQLARNIDEVFIIAENGDKIEYAGENSSRILNLTHQELYRHPEKLGALLEKEDADWLAGILSGPMLDSSAERDISAPGLGKFLKIRVYSICVPSTRQTRFIVVIGDQTEMIRHQEALSDALENAHAASAAKSSFLSHMSHEIRTPMNAIIGMTTIALSKIADQARVQDCLGKISESSRHLLGLINDVLDMSKIESGKLSISNEEFNLHQLLENIGNIVRPQIHARKQNFEILLENVDEENLVGDAMRLNQVLLNILSNACKFTPEGGNITLKLIQLEKKARSVCFRIIISDTGIGMSQEFLDRLYVPFEQATPATASRYGGTGLGMPITANLVSMMGGTINVQSREGAGTTFFLELPFGLSEEDAKRDGGLPPLRILVVDDDRGTCEHVSLLLDRMGLKTEWALTGEEGVAKVREAVEAGRPFDVCLIDWRMPGMGGGETAREIRKVVGADMLIIIISAYDLGAIEAEAKDAGVDAFIAKPFFSSTLHDALARATRQGVKKEEPEPAARHDFTGKRVLLVEDNEFNREIGQEFLEMVNIEVEHAENGREAVEKLVASAPGYYDLVLMDVQMPVMGGYEATRAIRASSHPQARTIPILAMTANAFREDVAQAMAAGMNGHLAKPIDVKELYKALARYLSPM
ncbi:MAG: response regulator, partial [Desulfovibrio sp.]|nr:response regulator [Desulfovibrio sp.]